MADEKKVKINRLRDITEMANNQELMNKIGLAYQTLVKRRTRKGIDIHGNKFEPYSTKPFARPAGGLPDNVFTRLDDTKEGTSHFIKGGALWVVIKGGYSRLREFLGEPTSPVNLTLDHVSGMLEKITYTSTIKADSASVEAWISDPDKAKIGYYHHVSGAGKSRVKREWWGLSDEDGEKIQKTVTDELDKYLNAKL